MHRAGWLDRRRDREHEPLGLRRGGDRRPTSICYDPNDTTLPDQHAEWLDAHILGAELVVIHALGHGSPEDPRADWNRLYSWLIA